MSMDDHGTKRRRNIAENSNIRVGRTIVTDDRQTDRRQTDGWAIAYSGRERSLIKH